MPDWAVFQINLQVAKFKSAYFINKSFNYVLYWTYSFPKK